MGKMAKRYRTVIEISAGDSIERDTDIVGGKGLSLLKLCNFGLIILKHGI